MSQQEDEANNFDLINVSGPLTIEAILKSLQQRFNNGHRYTWVGKVLLVINSFEPAGPKTHVVLRRLAELLLADLSNSSQPRVLVFGGLSGSGKSFTADQVLMKLFQLSHKTDWIQDLRRYWQVSSVVLKALGTACTQSNKDSSRIGRMVDFHLKGLQITKVKINCYFLDQTRMVNPCPTEQNYSIFYQLLAGLSPEERAKFQLNYHEVRSLHYLSQGLEPKDSPSHLQNHFEAWKSSLAQLGIPFTDVVKVLVAILLLGNVLFFEAKNQELSVQGVEELQAVGTLLGVQPHLLQKGLTLRTYSSERGEVVQSPCSAAAANGARDALAKALYVRTIVAIMRRVNTLLRAVSMQSQSGGGASTPHPQTPSPDDRTVHVVDLFGYESNDVNSLEQLCINWSAEKLQQYYIDSLFTKTVQMCQDEEVDPLFENSLYDCSPCVELIGGLESGLLQMLNQETLSPRVTSEDIRVRIRDKFSSNRCFVPPSGSSSTFSIRHFTGGETVYDLYSMLNANADTIADDIIATFKSKECKFGFVAHLFAVELNRDLQPDGMPRGQMCRITPAYLQHAPHSERLPTTYVQDFQSNLGDMLAVLERAKPFFIRCLKSNNSQTPASFDREVVSQQIQHMAIFESVNLIQSSFVNWMPYDEFIQRYHMLLPGSASIPEGHARELTNQLLQSMKQLMEEIEVSDDHYGLGKTKVFLNEEFRQSLEHMRERVYQRAVVKIQSVVRMFLARKHWPQLKFSLNQARLQGAAQKTLDKETVQPGSLPQNGELPYTVRNYTIVGNYKIGFPQWRIMRCTYPESGPPVLRVGDEVYVLGRSQKRGYLVVELNGQQMHLPHNYTELRLSPPHSPPPPLPQQAPPLAPPRMGRRPQPAAYSDL